jgi:Uma2 family endonuclease
LLLSRNYAIFHDKHILKNISPNFRNAVMDTYVDFDEDVDYDIDEDQEKEPVSDYERERGKPMPSFEHALTQAAFCGLIREKYPTFLAVPELSLNFGDFKPVPDVAVYPKSALPELRAMRTSKITMPPVLTVEILSPRQALYDVFTKAENFLAHGVDEAWVIVPEIGSITVFRKNEHQKTYISGDVRQESTGIVINIESLFTV